MLHAISRECVMAPSCITDWPLPLLSFSQSVLQAQQHLRLEELVGEVQGEEEPRGEDTVGPSGVAGEQSSGNALCVFCLKSFLKSHSSVSV